MRRRDFLKGGILSSLSTAMVVACGSDPDGTPPPGGPRPDGGGFDADKPVTPTSSPADSDKYFPQGLASGDPRADRVILWSRVEPTAYGKTMSDSFELEFIVAKDEALTDIVARGTVMANADGDHTVRAIPTGLEPGRFYYYRFEFDGKTTRVARTKTAPAADADVGVKFAMCACQDYIGRYWHAWRALLEEKAELDFVLYLGDYIYESVNDARFQETNPERAIKLPNGIDTSPEQDKSRIAAGTLEDYRAIYKVYRSDPTLKEVHRLYPFVVTWDDHEFADDCWQDHSTSFNELDPVTKGFTSEQNTPRRVAANRAFAEYQPADIRVDRNASFPNDITIYRKLNFGKHVDLFMTDQRMYRSDHVIPEGPTDTAVGKLTANTIVGSRYFVRKAVFDTREAAKKPTLLGAAQKAWFLDAVTKSNATWKVWGNEVQVYQMALKLGELPVVPDLVSYTVYVNADQWDGFRTERKEILQTFAQKGVKNLLVCTGDIHSFYASDLYVDFDVPAASPIGVEYVTAGISSASLRELVEKTVGDGPLASVGQAWASGASAALMRTNTPWLKYADTDAYGFTLMSVLPDRVEAVFVETSEPTEKEYKGVVSRKRFTTLVNTNRVIPAQ